jgi:hypothetical protein
VFLGILVLHTACGFGLSGNMDAADLPAAEKLFFAGQYRECAEIAGHEFHRGVWNDGWPKLLIRCQLATGQYDAARATYAKAIERFGSSIGLRLLGYDVYRYVNLPALAQRELDRIYEVASRAPSRYSSADDRITLGKFFLLRNQDARQVLELFYDRARRSNARLPAVYIATAELALQKHDYQVAADALETAAELKGDNPQIHYLQALAWKES